MADLMDAKTVRSASWLLNQRREALRRLEAARTLYRVPAFPGTPPRPEGKELSLPAVMEALAHVDRSLVDPMLIAVLDAAYEPLLAQMDEQLRAMGVEPPAPGDEDERHNRSLTE